MDDKEKIQLLQEHVSRLEEAWIEFVSIMEATGGRRIEALEKACPTYSNDVPERIQEFFRVYDDTYAERLPAIQKLYTAHQMDWKTALVSDPEMDDDQLVMWIEG